MIEWFVVGPADQKDAAIEINTVSTTQDLYGEIQKNRIGGKSVSSCNKIYSDIFVKSAARG